VRVLGIDTATGLASVGVCASGRPLASRSTAAGGSHAPTLLAEIDAVLEAAALRLADLELIAVSIGPGSFTGLRIALSTAKGLALAAGVPMVGVPTLAAYARAAGPRDGVVWVVLDARKGEVYAGAFQWRNDELVCVEEAGAHDPATLAERMRGPCTLLGDGVSPYASIWERRIGSAATYLALEALPPAGAVVACIGAERYAAHGAADLHALEPRYCRRSEAETGRRGR
jgi:tRNA threonylcarbamoyladenosine biosynthesis protein TsaB